HVFHEVFLAVGDDDVFDGVGVGFAGPGDAAGGAVGGQARAAGCGPVPEAFLGFGKVAVPDEHGGALASGWIAHSQWMCNADSSHTSAGWRCQNGGTTATGRP